MTIINDEQLNELNNRSYRATNYLYTEAVNLLNQLAKYKSTDDINRDISTLRSNIQATSNQINEVKNNNLKLIAERARLSKVYDELMVEIKAKEEAEEKRRKEEERIRLEEEKRALELERLRLQEEQRRQEQLKLEEARRIEQIKLEEQLKLKEQLRLEEQAKLQEQLRLQEQEILRLRELERIKLEEEAKKKSAESQPVILDTTPAPIIQTPVQNKTEEPKKGNAGVLIGATALGLAAYLFTKD